MERETILNKLKTILPDITNCDPDKITESAKLEDLGFDSLDEMDSIELVMALEEEFELEIDDTSYLGLETVGEVIDKLAEVLPA